MTICIIIFERLYYFFSIVEQHQYASHKKKVTVVYYYAHAFLTCDVWEQTFWLVFAKLLLVRSVNRYWCPFNIDDYYNESGYGYQLWQWKEPFPPVCPKSLNASNYFMVSCKFTRTNRFSNRIFWGLKRFSYFNRILWIHVNSMIWKIY